MTLPVIFMYSGQGSQYFQMGRGLYESNNAFKNTLTRLNQIYQDLTGISIIDHMYDDRRSKSEPFDKTLLTHPAIFMIEQALTQALYEKNIYPDAVLGSSLGEFSAAVTSGVLSLESAFTAVIKQGQQLETCLPGGMLAIINDTNMYQANDFLNQHAELAAINFKSHFVISGTVDSLTEIIKTLKTKGIAHLLLPVKQAFHSTYIDSAEALFRPVTESLTLRQTKYPYISCMKAKPMDVITHQHFWDIVRQPILFQQTITEIEAKQSALYIDIGPSGTLATFVKYNLEEKSSSKFYALLTPFGNDNLNLEGVTSFINK